MGNNNTSAIKEQDSTSNAEKKTHIDDRHEDSVKEENQINPTAKSEYADTKAAEKVSVDTSKLAIEISQEDTHENGVKEDEVKAVLEKAAKASDDITVEPGKDSLPEDSHRDDLNGEIQTVRTAEGKDVEENATWPDSGHEGRVFENDAIRKDTNAGDAHMENQMLPTAEDEVAQEKATELDSDHIELEKDSMEGDTCKEVVNDKHPTAEGTDVQEIAAKLAPDDKETDPKKEISQEDTQANDKDESALILFGGGTDVPGKITILDSDDRYNLRDYNGQEIPEVRQPERSPNAESVEDGGENYEILSSSSLEGTEDYGNQTESCLAEDLLVTSHDHIESEPKQEEDDTKFLTLDAVDMSNEAELQDSPVVDPNHNELVKILSESSLQGSESWPKGDSLDTNPLCSQDNDDVIERETQTEKNNISSDMSEVRDRDEFESSLGDLSGTKCDSQSGNVSNGNLLPKVNYITDDSQNPLSESVNVGNPLMHDSEENNKVLHEERKMSRSGSTIQSSHDYNRGECLQEPLNEFKACIVNTYDMTIGSKGDSNGEINEELTSSVSGITSTDGECLQEPLNEFKACIVNTYDVTIGSKGDSNGEINEELTSSVSGITCTDEVERPIVTENGHNFDAFDNNPNKASDNTSIVPEQKQLAVPEAEVVPLIAVSTDCIEEEGEDCKKKIEETYKNPEASHAAEKGLEGRDMLEKCNSNLVAIDHVESLSLENSNSLLHIYSYQEGSENQNKNLTATSMSNSDWKQASDTNSFCSKVDKLDSSSSSVPALGLVDDRAFEKEWEDCSLHVETTSTSEAKLTSEQCPNNSTFENGDYETRKSTTRSSTESNSDSLDISSQMQKSPSFNLNLQIEASSGESDQSPFLYQDKCTTEMPVEEKIVTMEISYTEKSKAPLLGYSKEDGEAHLLVTSQEQGNHAGTHKTVKQVVPTSPKPKEKRKPMSSFFINCMCCATLAN